jgi:fructan beta-fructosidase
VFANDGEAAFTSLVFPKEAYQQLQLLAEGGTVQLASLKLTEMKSIWGA